MGKGNLPKTDNCYYIGRSLPVLQKMCSTPPTQSTCYYDWATSYTGVDPTWIERGKYENKILICDSDEIPGWVKETCRWVDSGNQFLCGKLGEPLLNMRVFASTDYVEVGSLNLIKNVWEDLKDTSEISGINCFSPPTRILMTHGLLFCPVNRADGPGTGCWGSLDAPQSEGNLKVLVRQWGVWGTLERRNNASFPVVLNEREVGGWLKLALWTALEHLKKSPYKVYYVWQSRLRWSFLHRHTVQSSRRNMCRKNREWLRFCVAGDRPWQPLPGSLRWHHAVLEVSRRFGRAAILESHYLRW
ncbi:hypothetical protein BCR37DRAFT_376175 [Protomyces lactucae-debilis]|uniref:Uncharacterized protein n=1 Tax=Protomyces lactucae-debilis TaxID=2754530 RepID=A0A1Y2FW49_PROLT|nr:uncharacterized protein BCR37DRAFT_376175 [Protomyces lactucae-debilis]ORY86895.1 hypothetical protein BCR37DRAFT_376175 [Protomyces lactucae-debilis]